MKQTQRDERGRERGEEEEEEKEKEEEAKRERKGRDRDKEPNQGLAPLPPSVIAAHMMEDWIPHGRFDISSIVFIQTGARAAVVATNL